MDNPNIIPDPININFSEIIVKPQLPLPIPVNFNVSDIILTPNLQGPIIMSHVISLDNKARHAIATLFYVNLGILIALFLIFLLLIISALCPISRSRATRTRPMNNL